MITPEAGKPSVEPSEAPSSGIASRWDPDTWVRYSTRGLGVLVGVGRCPAVLVVDMSRAFNDPRYRVGADQSQTVAAIAALLAISRPLRVPTFYTTMAYLPDGSDGGMLAKKMPALLELRLDDPAAIEVDDRISPQNGEITINKKAASAFFGTNLLSLLVARGTDTLILTGCSTSGCIRATAIDGASYGFHVVIPVECVSDRAEGPHYANLFDMAAKYADVMPLVEVLAYLRTSQSLHQ